MRITRIERPRINDDANKPPLWLIGLTDLVTLLLAFFILLYSTTEPRKASWNSAKDSIRDSFGGDESATDTGNAGHKDAEKTWKSEENIPGLEIEYLDSLIRERIKSDPNLSRLIVWKNHDHIILSFGAELGFEPGMSDLTEQGRIILNSLAIFLNTLPNNLEVVGMQMKHLSKVM